MLRGEGSVLLRQDAGRKRKDRTRDRAAPGLRPEDEALFQALRALRTELARERGVPAYVIFPDATLIEIAARKPADLDALAGCHGVGTRKLADFGEAFLAVVRSVGQEVG